MKLLIKLKPKPTEVSYLIEVSQIEYTPGKVGEGAWIARAGTRHEGEGRTLGAALSELAFAIHPEAFE